MSSERIQTTPSHPLKHQEEQGQGQTLQPQQQQQQPFVLAMDVEMCAPVISMPRNSSNGDAIEVDLGVLRLTTTVSSNGTGSTGGGDDEISNSVVPLASSLLEKAELTFSGVGFTVVQAGRRGHSVVKNPEQGWKLGWRRPLVPLERGDVPFVSQRLHLFFIYFLPFFSQK